ncbi:MAG: hypothetical protein HY695_09000 [Deltaproteobacteria bacterium]|nr:hypothetical protein [Deltaproteobacteria bacterium]
MGASVESSEEQVEAWRTIQPVREAAANAQTAGQAASQFARRFGKSLADLENLYVNSHWKHAAAIGGHAWRGVTAAVAALRDAIEGGDIKEIEGATRSLLTARHNNGPVCAKITEVDGLVGIQSGEWWQ